ncbi:hypothetical protein [Mangrovibacterium marinum]|uniref:Uncharacterized protein n=1 Tax=Mangrovibacterium marinum TaxID=1639118 RepID=A0A2T5C3N1_9BACT|nr:hypothetical protein [Mangrovibacterium marinum]PTN09346.1 hypothetical protein C8N47_105187 [Mangrovibacterium marinum]
MKSAKNSKKDFKKTDIENNESRGLSAKGVKKDRSGKKRLSIYDEFDDDDLDLRNYKREEDEDDYEDDED